MTLPEREGAVPRWNALSQQRKFQSAHIAAVARRALLIEFLGTIPPFPADCFSFCAEPFRPLAQLNRDSPSLLPETVVQHADARGLFDGLIWPKSGCASIV